MEEEVDEYGIKIKKSTEPIDEYGIPVKKKEDTVEISETGILNSQTQQQDGSLASQNLTEQQDNTPDILKSPQSDFNNSDPNEILSSLDDGGLKLKEQAIKNLEKFYNESNIKEFNITDKQITEEAIRIQESKTEDDKFENMDFLSDTGKKIKANTKSALAGLAQFPSFINKQIATILMSEEDLETLNELPTELREIVINATASSPIAGFGALAQKGAELHDELTKDAEKIHQQTTQFNTSIGEDLLEGDYAKAGTRIASEGLGSIPSLVQAMIPYVGIGSIVAGSAANKQEELEDEGFGLGWQTSTNAVLSGTAEGLADVFTKKIGTKLWKTMQGSGAPQTVLKGFKDWAIATGGEGSSEALTGVVQELSDAYISGKEVDFNDAFKRIADQFLIGGGVGGGIGGTTFITERVKSVRDNSRIEAVVNSDSNEYTTIKDAFVQTSDFEVEIDKASLVAIGNSPNAISKDLSRSVKKGELTQAEADQYQAEFDSTRDAYKKTQGTSLSVDDRVKSIGLIKEKESIKTDIETLDDALAAPKKERIQEIDEELSNIVTPKKTVDLENIPSTTESKSTVSKEATEFAEKLGEQEDISNIINGATKVSIGNTDVIIKSEGDNIKIESISTPKDERGKGSAKNAIEKITDIADEQNSTLELNVAPLDNETNVEGLLKLYEGAGFVKDENFDKEDGGRMVREPKNDNIFENIDKIVDETTESEKKSAYDFDGTLFDNKTQEITQLGKDIQEKIASGEDITIISAREDTAENRQFIAEKLGISAEKIKLVGGQNQNSKKAQVLDELGIDRKNFLDADKTKQQNVLNGIDNEATTQTPQESKVDEVLPDENKEVETEKKIESDVDYALNEIQKGLLLWDGNPLSPRVNLGISRRDIRKGEADLLKGNNNTVPAKRLIEAIKKAKENGGYDYIEGSGKLINKIFVPLTEEFLQQETDLTKEELEILSNEQEVLVKEYDDFFNNLDKNTQNEILEDYENKSREVSEDAKKGKSQKSVIVEKKGKTPSKEINLSESLHINDFLENLDNISDQLDKFGKETLGINLPVAVAKIAIGAMKIAGKTAKTTADVISAGLNAVKKTDWYKNLSKNDKDDIDKNLAQRITNPLVKEQSDSPKSNKQTDYFKKETGKKSVFSRIYQGDTSEKLKENVEKHGLDFQIESQEKAQVAAKKFVKEVGINKALDALRSNIIKGAEKAFVYAEVLDALLEMSETSSLEEISKIQEDYSNILEESMVAFDQEAREAGRFISALNKVYNTSKIKYSLTRQVNDYKANNHGFIDEETLTKFKEADKNIKRLEAEIETLIKQQKTEIGNEAIQSINEDIERNKASEKKKRSNAKIAKNIAKNIRKAKIHRPEIFSAATPVSLIWDGAVETVAKSIEAGGVIADSIQKGIDFIKNTDWYSKLSTKNKNKAIQEFQKNINNLSDQKNITISDSGEIKIPEQTIRDLVESGINDINELSNAIINIIKETNPDSNLTLREVRDAITKYGKIINPSKDEVKQKIAELKRVGRLISGLEDVISGKKPKRSGFQRPKPTRTERELNREINDKMRDLPLDDSDLQNDWKTALDRTKTRLQNQIEDLENQIVNKEKRKVKRESVKLDNEAQELKTKRDELRSALNELVGKPEVTEEQKIKKAVRNLETSIEKLTNQISDKNLEFKEKPEQVTSNEIERLKNVKSKLQIELNKLREKTGVIERKRLKQAKTRLQNQIEEYQLRLLEKDFSKKERKPLKTDKELKELRREKIQWQEVFEQEKYALEIKNRSLAEYSRELIVGLLNIPRILMAGGEMSMVFIQGGIQTISLATRNPKALVRTFAKAFVAVGSQRRMDEYSGTLKADTSYDLMKQSGLALTQSDYKMELREEEFIGNNLVYGLWNAIGKGLEYGSVKVFGIKNVGSVGSTLLRLVKKDVAPNMIPISERFKNMNPLLAFERGNTVYMNELRRLRFEDGMKMLQMEGKNENDFMVDYKKLASAINTMTGRANIGRLERINDIIGTVFFSFKNTVSVFNQLNPYFYASLHSPNDPITKASVAQKLAMRDMLSFVTITTSMMLLLQSAAGDDENGEPIIYIENDPRSSSFMQMKIKGKNKHIRFDVWHGMRTQVVFLSRLISGEKKRKGKIKRIGKGYKVDTQWDNFTRTYIENKFSPSAGMIFKYLDSEIKEVDGEEVRMRYGEPISESYKENFYPMYINAINEIEDEDPDLVLRFLTATAFFGVNSSVYDEVKK